MARHDDEHGTGSTMSTGAPAPSDRHSLTIGPDGPIVLHDVHFLEQMAHFNREKVPERQPHAKGGGAFGVFETTGDVSRYTRAALFQPGARTDLLIRFSTVAGEMGSPDTWRDVRGFSIKFYTSEGNYDLVGNNTPVFFVRDPMKFPHFIRSQKRLPDSGLRDNHMQWDFWTLNPESAHQVTYLMGERGLPRTWRNMNGYGSHTFMWVNAAGEHHLVEPPPPPAGVDAGGWRQALRHTGLVDGRRDGLVKLAALALAGAALVVRWRRPSPSAVDPLR